MLSEIVPRVVGVVVYCVVLFGVASLLGRGRTPEKRHRDGDEWARRHLAYVEPRWVPDVDRCLEHNRRVELWGMAFFGLALWSVPRSLGAYVACLAVVPALVAISVVVASGVAVVTALHTDWWVSLASIVLDGRDKAAPAAYMRSRLWPGLAPDEVVPPGEPVPSRGAMS